jgi:hypothetical protein
MDEEDGIGRESTASVEKVSLISHEVDGVDEDVEDYQQDSSKGRTLTSLSSSSSLQGDSNQEEELHLERSFILRRGLNHKSSSASAPPNLLHRTLLPDSGISIRGYPLLEGGFSVKLLKFICLTFVLIAIVHVIVAKLFSDRDKSLRLWHIWVYEGELIVRDCVVFFLVGRMWKQRGIDHLAWLGTALVANLYFESQNFVPFLQHSVTLYQMHCIWPWELWLFVIILIPSIGAVVVAHVVRAYERRILYMKLTELSLCVFFFVAPLVTSSYFHLHHWYAGQFLLLRPSNAALVKTRQFIGDVILTLL